MFHCDHVDSEDRVNPQNGKPLVWANLPRPDKDEQKKEMDYEVMCR